MTATGDIVERLRDRADSFDGPQWAPASKTLLRAAADRLEQLDAERDQLERDLLDSCGEVVARYVRKNRRQADLLLRHVNPAVDGLSGSGNPNLDTPEHT